MPCVGCQKRKDKLKAWWQALTDAPPKPAVVPCLCATHGRQHCALHQREDRNSAKDNHP